MSNFNSWPPARTNNNGYMQSTDNANGNNFFLNSAGLPSFEEFNNQFQNGLGMPPTSFTPVNLFANPVFTQGLSSLAQTQPSAPLSTAASEDGEIDEALDNTQAAAANAIMIYLPDGRIKGKNTSSSVVCENVSSDSAARELFREVDRSNIVRTLALDPPSKGFIVGFRDYSAWRKAWENAPEQLKRMKQGGTKQTVAQAAAQRPLGHVVRNGTTPNGQMTSQTGTSASEDKANLLRSKLLAMKMKTSGQEEVPAQVTKNPAPSVMQSTPSRVATPATIIPPGLSADVFSSEIDKLIEQGRAAAATNGHAANGLQDKVEHASKAQARVIEVDRQSSMSTSNKPPVNWATAIRQASQQPTAPLAKPKPNSNHLDDSSRKNGKLEDQHTTSAASHSTDQAGLKAVDEVAQYQKLQEISKRMASQSRNTPQPSHQSPSAAPKPVKEDLTRSAQKPAAPVATHDVSNQAREVQQQIPKTLITPKSPTVYASSEPDTIMMDSKEGVTKMTEASSQGKPQEIPAPKAEIAALAPVQIPLTVPAQQPVEPTQAVVQAVQDTVEAIQPVEGTQDPHNYYEDLEDWLEITGYHNLEHRKKIVARHRKKKDLEAQLAQLELESRLETPFPVRASVQPQPMEDLKASISMPPPPLPFAKPSAVAKPASIITSTATSPSSPVFPAKSNGVSKAASTITTTATSPDSPVFPVTDPTSRKRSVSQVVDSSAAQRPSKNMRTESTDDPRQRAATYSNGEYASASYESRKYDPTYSPRDYSASTSYYQYPSGSGSTSAEPLERRVSMPNNKKAYYNNSVSNYGDQRNASRDAYDYRDDYYGYTSNKNRGRGDRYRGPK